MGPRASLNGYGKSRPSTGVCIPNCPAHNKSQRQLRFPGCRGCDLSISTYNIIVSSRIITQACADLDNCHRNKQASGGSSCHVRWQKGRHTATHCKITTTEINADFLLCKAHLQGPTTANRQRAGRPTTRFHSRHVDRNVHFSVHTGYEAQRVRCVLQPWRDAEHTLPSRIEIKKAWSYTSTPRTTRRQQFL